MRELNLWYHYEKARIYPLLKSTYIHGYIHLAACQQINLQTQVTINRLLRKPFRSSFPYLDQTSPVELREHLAAQPATRVTSAKAGAKVALPALGKTTLNLAIVFVCILCRTKLKN